MKPIKKRRTPLMSKRKMVTAINLYEKYVDEPIENIKILSSNEYEFVGRDNNYVVDIANNNIRDVHPDPEW